MHAIAHWGVQTPQVSLHWKLTLKENSLAAPGNRTCASSMPAGHSTNWTTSPPETFFILIYMSLKKNVSTTLYIDGTKWRVHIFSVSRPTCTFAWSLLLSFNPESGSLTFDHLDLFPSLTVCKFDFWWAFLHSANPKLCPLLLLPRLLLSLTLRRQLPGNLLLCVRDEVGLRQGVQAGQLQRWPRASPRHVGRRVQKNAGLYRATLGGCRQH